jgi:hypothetical protein
MTFVPRDLPKVIFFEDVEIIGPFCDWCGNPGWTHRSSDQACPKRSMSPLLPRGKREAGCIKGTSPTCFHPACPAKEFHFDPIADAKFARHLLAKRGNKP